MNKVILLTGRSGAGKTTLGRRIAALLGAIYLDGDEVRAGLCSDLDFTREARAENLRRMAHVAKLIQPQHDGGIVIAAIAPYRDDRAALREIIGQGFLEVYVKASAEACASRDPKGLYAAGAHNVGHYEEGTPDIVVFNEGCPVEKPLWELFHALR